VRTVGIASGEIIGDFSWFLQKGLTVSVRKELLPSNLRSGELACSGNFRLIAFQIHYYFTS
jgi:hypothetical protein